MSHLKEFQKIMEGMAGRYHIWRIFEDWVEVAAIECAQPVWYLLTGDKSPDLENRYLEIVRRYDPEEVRGPFSQLFVHLVKALQEEPHDFLGQAFMELDLGSHWHGQFFTPYNLSRMMAATALREVPEKEVITISEPACGSGGMLIAAAEALKDMGLNPSTRMHAVATDVDPTCFYMAYTQLSLMGISAEVVLGNTLSLETRKCWRTTASAVTMHTMDSLSRKARVDLDLPKEIIQSTFETWGAC